MQQGITQFSAAPCPKGFLLLEGNLWHSGEQEMSRSKPGLGGLGCPPVWTWTCYKVRPIDLGARFLTHGQVTGAKGEARSSYWALLTQN